MKKVMLPVSAAALGLMGGCGGEVPTTPDVNPSETTFEIPADNIPCVGYPSTEVGRIGMIGTELGSIPDERVAAFGLATQDPVVLYALDKHIGGIVVYTVESDDSHSWFIPVDNERVSGFIETCLSKNNARPDGHDSPEGLRVILRHESWHSVHQSWQDIANDPAHPNSAQTKNRLNLLGQKYTEDMLYVAESLRVEHGPELKEQLLIIRDACDESCGDLYAVRSAIDGVIESLDDKDAFAQIAGRQGEFNDYGAINIYTWIRAVAKQQGVDSLTLNLPSTLSEPQFEADGIISEHLRKNMNHISEWSVLADVIQNIEGTGHAERDIREWIASMLASMGTDPDGFIAENKKLPQERLTRTIEMIEIVQDLMMLNDPEIVDALKFDYVLAQLRS